MTMMTLLSLKMRQQLNYLVVVVAILLISEADRSNAFSSSFIIGTQHSGTRLVTTSTGATMYTAQRFSTTTTTTTNSAAGQVFMTSDNNNSNDSTSSSTAALAVEEELGTTAALQQEFEELNEQLQEQTVFMRSLLFDLETTPFGITLEEIETGGVYCLECDVDGAAYAAGIRDGDVIAALNGNEEILSTTLDGAMAMLGAETSGETSSTSFPISIKVYRPMEEEVLAGKSRETSIVKMAPRRLPSAKKLVMASTNAKFWQDPVMIGSALLTVAMPLGIYVASKGM